LVALIIQRRGEMAAACEGDSEDAQ